MEASIAMNKKWRQEWKKGHWSPDEDKLLTELVIRDGPGQWSQIAKQIRGRRGSSCRARWVNHLNPQVVKTPFSKEEKERLLQLHREHGNKWSSFVGFFRGRTDNQLKNQYHSLTMSRKAKSSIPSYINNHRSHLNIGSIYLSEYSNLTNVSQFSDVPWWGKKTDMPLFNGGSSSFYAGDSTLFGPRFSDPGTNGFYSFENTNIANVYANLVKIHGVPVMSQARSVAQPHEGVNVKTNQFIDFLGVGDSE